MSQLLIQEEEQHTCGTSVEARYSELLRTHIVRAYDRADRGELWGPEATAAVKLRTLEGAMFFPGFLKKTPQVRSKMSC